MIELVTCERFFTTIFAIISSGVITEKKLLPVLSWKKDKPQKLVYYWAKYVKQNSEWLIKRKSTLTGRMKLKIG
jgi:hypothetical protein